MVDIRLKGFEAPEIHPYLSENDWRMQFSLLKRAYYSAVRPVVPQFVRRRLQHAVISRVNCRPDFIWPEFVDLVRRDEAAWSRMTSSLYPDDCDAAIVLTHDVETQAGYDFIPKVIELEQRYGLRSSWNLVAKKYHLRHDVIDLIRRSGHEIGIHGYNHDGTLYYSKRRFLWRAARINEALAAYDAVGFRSPQVHRDLAWLQHLDILYDASCFDYDPYQPFPGGTGSIWPFTAGKFVELPYTLPQDHTLFCMLGMRDIGVWRRKTRWLVENRGMILSLTHPDYLMENDRLSLYEEFLAFLCDIPRTWRCLPREMAQRYSAL